MGRPQTKSGRINVTKKEDIVYVYKYLKREGGKSKATYCVSDDELCAKTEDILHVSRSSVRKIVFPDDMLKPKRFQNQNEKWILLIRSMSEGQFTIGMPTRFCQV